MSDVSKTNAFLIAEARNSFKATNASASLIRRLADALEAATRVPVQGEPNDDREAEVIEIACWWADYRKEYGVSAQAMTEAHAAFKAGWKARSGSLDVGGVLR